MKQVKYLEISLFIFLVIELNGIAVESAKILIFIGALSSYSHRASIQPLANRLAERGHEVTFFTPLSIPSSQPKSIKDFCPSELTDSHQYFLTRAGVGSFRSRIENEFFNELVDQATEMFGRSETMCENILKSPSFKSWSKGKKFDLFIIDSAINTCAFGLAHYFKAKTIIYSSLGFVVMWDLITFGVPPELSWVPGLTTRSLGGQMTLLERFLNAFSIFTLSSAYRFVHLPKIERQLKESFMGPHMESMSSLEGVIRNTSLMLVNQHYSDQYPKSYPPFVVPVGGIHLVDSNGTLPGVMEDFIQEQIQDGKDGFVYISFGSLIKISMMPQHLLDVFLEVIRNSKWSFLFKWDGPIPENPPKNVLFNYWFPQQQVLAHSKIRGFITQGGQVSLQEAIYNQVPMVILPVFADQDFNAKRMEVTGNGIMLELAGLTSSHLEETLEKIVTDPVMRMNVIKLARSSRDRPMSALDSATWWTEHVLANDDLSHLKPLNTNQNMWKQWDFDVWAVFFFLIEVLIVAIFFFLKFVIVQIIRIRFFQNLIGNRSKTVKGKIL